MLYILLCIGGIGVIKCKYICKE